MSLVVIAGQSFPGLARAQEQAEADDITVTAERTSGDLRIGVLGERAAIDVPLSATGYTSALILDQSARSTAEVLANDPSIRVQSAGDGNYDYFSLRGFSIAASAFSLDGLYGVLPWNTLSPEAVERFAVIRGPATTFTGASPFDNAGGSVEIAPKRAPDRGLTRLTATFDVGGQLGGHADVGHRFGANDQWGLRVNAAYRDGETARDHQSEHVELLTLGADYRGDRLRLGLDAGYQDFRTDGASFLYYIYEGTPVPNAPETDHNISPEWSQAKSRDKYAAIRAEFAATEAFELFAAVGTRDHQSAIVNPYTEIADGDGDLNVYPYQEAYFSKTHWSAEAGAQLELTTGSLKHALVLNASGIDFDTGWLGTYSDGFDPLPDYLSNLYDPTYPGVPDLSDVAARGELQLRNKLTGIALLDTISTNDERYQLTLGVRRQKFDIQRLYEPDNPYRDSAWSPSVALLAKVTPELSIYANYLTGLSQGPFAPVGTANQNQPFPPNKNQQYELGLKAQVGSILTSVALFQITQPAGLTDPVTNAFNVDGKQRHRGLEWIASGEVADGVRLLGGLNLIDAKLVKTQDGAFDGNRAPGVARFTANLNGEWDVAAVDGLTLTGRLLYTGKQPVFADNEQRIDEWARLDLGAKFTTVLGGNGVAFRLNAVNVTGEDYWASAKGFGLTLGSPRSVILSASIDF